MMCVCVWGGGGGGEGYMRACMSARALIFPIYQATNLNFRERRDGRELPIQNNKQNHYYYFMTVERHYIIFTHTFSGSLTTSYEK